MRPANSFVSSSVEVDLIGLDEFRLLSDANQMRSFLDAIRPTTFIRSSKLNDLLGLDLTIAAETFQHTGSFKFRAAYNVALHVPNSDLLTASSGNFGQALAYSAKLLGKRCTVVMPTTSAQVKIDAVRSFGATVDLIDVAKVGRNERLEQLQNEMPSAYLASPYNDTLVIEGNASLADELADRAFDAVVVPVGGGGLISGIISGFRRLNVGAEIVGAEPALGNDAARSLQAGELIANETEPMTIADGARTLCLGDLNWEIIRSWQGRIVEVPDALIAASVKHYFSLANLKAEPTGALSLGAILTKPEIFADRKVCVIVSGGNVDANVYAGLI